MTETEVQAVEGPNIEADVVIIGAGLFGGLMATQLQRQGLKVAMLDSGPTVDRVEAVKQFKASPYKTGNSPYPKRPYAPIPPEADPMKYYYQPNAESTNPLEQSYFGALYLRTVGGTSWHFTGHAERMYPQDFTMKSSYGVGEDWPITYELLEPYYRQVEREWGVAGDASVVAPTVHPYPLPVVPLTYLDKTVNKGVEKFGDSIGPLPHCRNSVPFDGRPQCCGNASCRFICPVGAKYDGSVHVNKAVNLGAKLYTSHVVDQIVVDENQKVQHVHFKNYTDPYRPIYGIAKAKRYILAAHGIESPRLLLMSKGPNTPNGVANSSDQVGRNLMSMVGINMEGYAPEPVYPYRGPVNATGAFRELRDGEFRKDFASIATIVINGGFDPTNGPLNEADDAIEKGGLFGKELRERVRKYTAAQVYLDNSVEVLPNPENRVTLAEDQPLVFGLPRPQINFKLDEYTVEGVFVSWKRGIETLRAMGCTHDKPDGTPIPEPTREEFDKYVDEHGIRAGAAMIAGTCRMGDDPKTSVVNQYCKSHDHDNLYIVGTSNYVTAGSVSPSLTAAAISLRAADFMINEFQNEAG